MTNGGGWKDWAKLFGVLFPIAGAIMTPLYLTLSAVNVRVGAIEVQMTDVATDTQAIKSQTESLDRLYEIRVRDLEGDIDTVQRRVGKIEDSHRK